MSKFVNNANPDGRTSEVKIKDLQQSNHEQGRKKKDWTEFVPLAIFTLGICSCYWCYGYLQETLITKSRLGATFLLVIQSVTNVLVAIVWVLISSSFAVTRNDSRHSTDTKISPPSAADDAAADSTKSQRSISTSDKTTTTVMSTSSDSLNHRLLFMTSICYVVAMVCSNEALQFVSYSTAVLMKSCKLIPNLVMGVLMERRTYSTQTWISAITISFGMCLFHSTRLLFGRTSNTGQTNNSSSSGAAAATADDEQRHYWYGIVLLSLSLTMDGLLGACQGLLKRTKKPQQKHVPPSSQQHHHSDDQSSYYRPPTAAETMLYINLYSLLVLVPLSMISSTGGGTIGRGHSGSDGDRWPYYLSTERLLHNSQFGTGLRLLQRDPSLQKAVIAMNVVVGLGQIFIFLSLTWYTPYITTLITTTRKFFTIIISVLIVNSGSSTGDGDGNNNEFGTIQWVAVMLVFGGIYSSIMSATLTTAKAPTKKTKLS